MGRMDFGRLSYLLNMMPLGMGGMFQPAIIIQASKKVSCLLKMCAPCISGSA